MGRGFRRFAPVKCPLCVQVGVCVGESRRPRRTWSQWEESYGVKRMKGILVVVVVVCEMVAYTLNLD